MSPALTLYDLEFELCSGLHWKYSVYIDHEYPLHGFTGCTRLRLSVGSMPNHGEKKAKLGRGFSLTFHFMEMSVMRSVPSGTDPTA